MTPAATRLLTAMRDEEEDLVCDRLECWVGLTRFSRRTVTALLRLTAISECRFPGGGETYTLNDTGRALLRRPELEAELMNTLLKGSGSFTIRDDRVVPL